ncbi:MAG: hypothetical protein ACI4SR_00705 [Faecalibacillus sp.]
MNKFKELLYKYRILVIIACIFLICVCGYGLYQTFASDNGYITSVEDGDKTIVKTDSVSISKNDLYEYFLDYNGANLTLDSAINYITENEITDKDAINKKVEELKEQYISYVGGDLDSYAKENGYDDEQSFVNDNILPSAKSTLLQEKFIDQNYKNLLKDYKIKYIKTITFDTESQALKIIKGSKDEASFNNYMNEFDGTDQGMVSTESSSLDENIIKKLNKFTKDGIYSKAIKTSDSKYAVIWVYNTDKFNLKDEIKKSLSELSDISDKTEAYYLKKYNFDVYDPKIKEQIKDISEDYFG